MTGIKKLKEVAEEHERERRINDTRTPGEKLIAGVITREDYMEEVANQENKYGEPK